MKPPEGATPAHPAQTTGHEPQGRGERTWQKNLPNLVPRREPDLDPKPFKVAIPLTEGKLCSHFGHCDNSSVIRVKEGLINGKEIHSPPPHEPGFCAAGWESWE